MLMNELYLQDLVDYIEQTDASIFDGSKTSKEDLLKEGDETLEKMWGVYQKDVEEYGCDTDFSYADALKEVLGIDLKAKRQQPNSRQKDSTRSDELNKATYEVCCAFAKEIPRWDMSYIEQVNEYVEYALSAYGYPVRHSGVKTHEKLQTLPYAKAEFARMYTPENRKKYEPYLNQVRKLCRVFAEKNNSFSLVMLTAIAKRVDEALRRNGIETAISGIWQVIHGDYVATPIKNAFNNKTAYWLSKKGFTKACYMFTVEECVSQTDLEDRLTEKGFKAYEWFFADSEPKDGSSMAR